MKLQACCYAVTALRHLFQKNNHISIDQMSETKTKGARYARNSVTRSGPSR